MQEFLDTMDSLAKKSEKTNWEEHRKECCKLLPFRKKKCIKDSKFKSKNRRYNECVNDKERKKERTK